MNRVGSPDVTASQAGWSRTEGKEDEEFIFTLDVTRSNPELDSYCIIYALNYDVAEVGRRDVFIPAGDQYGARGCAHRHARASRCRRRLRLFHRHPRIPSALAPARALWRRQAAPVSRWRRHTGEVVAATAGAGAIVFAKRRPPSLHRRAAFMY